MESKKDILSKLTATRNIIKKKFKHAYEERMKRERKVAEILKPITSKMSTSKSTSDSKKEETGELDKNQQPILPSALTKKSVIFDENNKSGDNKYFDSVTPSTSAQLNQNVDYYKFENATTSTPKLKLPIKMEENAMKKSREKPVRSSSFYDYLPTTALDFSSSPEALRILDRDRLRREDIIKDIATNAAETAAKSKASSRDNATGRGMKKNYNSMDFNFVPYHRDDHIIYEYVTDPNELCNRLKLLISSKIAGNSNHAQEIQSIIDELRELGCIV